MGPEWCSRNSVTKVRAAELKLGCPHTAHMFCCGRCQVPSTCAAISLYRQQGTGSSLERRPRMTLMCPAQGAEQLREQPLQTSFALCCAILAAQARSCAKTSERVVAVRTRHVTRLRTDRQAQQKCLSMRRLPITARRIASPSKAAFAPCIGVVWSRKASDWHSPFLEGL